MLRMRAELNIVEHELDTLIMSSGGPCVCAKSLRIHIEPLMQKSSRYSKAKVCKVERPLKASPESLRI